MEKYAKKLIKIDQNIRWVLVSRQEYFDQKVLLEVVDYDVKNIPSNFQGDCSSESRATKMQTFLYKHITHLNYAAFTPIYSYLQLMNLFKLS